MLLRKRPGCLNRSPGLYIFFKFRYKLAVPLLDRRSETTKGASFVCPVSKSIRRRKRTRSLFRNVISMKQQKLPRRTEKTSGGGNAPLAPSDQGPPAPSELLQKALKEIYSSRSLPAVLKRVLRNGMKLAQMESGWILLWDDEGKALTVEMVANAPERLIGKKLKPGEDQAGRAAQERKSLSGHGNPESPLFSGVPGAIFDLSLSVPLIDGDKLVGVVCFGTQAPGRVLAEDVVAEVEVFAPHAAAALFNAGAFQALEKRNGELERKAVEAARESESLREEMLRKEKLAVLGQLVGSVNHELRQPLEVITNAVYYLKMQLRRNDIGPIKKEFERFLNIISGECVNTTDLVNELLDFTRKKEAAPLGVDLNKLLDSQLEKIRLPAKVKVKRRFDPNLPMVYADPVQLSRAFYNILLNGVQAMPKGGALRLATESAEGSVVVSVQDSGVGIPLEHLKKIFQPLFTTKTKGIGLGLALVKEYIEVNQGRIEVQSKEGSGTTFQISFPSMPLAEGAAK